MKKILTILLAALVVFSLAACGASGETEEQTAARELDAQIWAVVKSANEYAEALSDAVEDADVDRINSMAEEVFALQESLDELPAETSAAMLYVGAARAYTANVRVVLESVYAYLTDGDESDLEDFSKYWGKIGDLTDNVVEKRKDFLADVGFSKSEIADFPA